ncbi:pentatricopeptide repeat protein [Microsporum canis CBS 113480]|uniref:Pentatricopeptide repeat protein n=1 Tax=Arthroderma otae (strain ATCC MYA-4605 / CBS 113480) TaxID=554155 RepID=C5FF02_ARTOC|nr:pentatricopeptide repeat protein [Microsporum canis CBS 113480]EEQ28296.1 pentatricopeptide repeat protein [Microsporum canis CBS 113480]
MSLLRSLERPTSAQLIVNVGQCCLQPDSLRSSRANRFSIMRRSLSSLAVRTNSVLVTDNFISCLVAAGFCKKHAPHKNTPQMGPSRPFIPTAARRLQSTLSGALLAESKDDIPDRNNVQSSKKEEQWSCKRRRSKNWQENDHTSNGIGPPVVVKGPKHGLGPKRALPKDLDLGTETYLRAKHANTEESKLLFGLYLGVLGDVEGTTSLKVVLSNPQREVLVPPQPRNQAGKDDLEANGVSHLISLLEQEDCTDQELFAAYKRIPSLGVSYLSARTRGKLLHRFAKPERRGRTGVFYYLTLVDDMCDASLEMSPSLWTAAIHLAGKSSSTVKREDLNAAIGVWRRMEHEGNISSSSVAFNILFDLAIKSGQFRVAERIIADMKKRNIKFSRFGRVAQIFFNGLKGSARGVRRAYDDFIKAGEVVDTVVLNCVIASLIRSGEAKLAELMYERMKEAHERLKADASEKAVMYPMPSQDYSAYRKASKQLGRVLGMTSYLHDKLPDHHRALQAAMPLTPDAKTFHILLSYHAHITGDLGRFLSLLSEMEGTLSIPSHGMVYILLFQGFAIHGSKKNTTWTYPRLQRAWLSFLRAVRDYDAAVQTKQRTVTRKSKFTWFTETSFVQGQELEHRTTAEEMEEAEEEFKNEADRIFHGTFNDAREELEDDWKYENAVYLGRTVIIACLRAFYTCGGRTAVLGVWEQIDQLWQGNLKQRDIDAVRAVLRELVPRRGH